MIRVYRVPFVLGGALYDIKKRNVSKESFNVYLLKSM